MDVLFELNSGTTRALWIKLRRLGSLNLSLLRGSLLLKPLTASGLTIILLWAKKVHIKMLFGHNVLIPSNTCILDFHVTFILGSQVLL